MEQPTTDSIIKAYNIAKEAGEENTCKVLEALYPNVEFEPKDNRPVEERIKTFEDALEALGEDNCLVRMFKEIYEESTVAGANMNSDVVAYLKLRIIVAALNEGWYPEYTEDECRWYPWFYLYTNEELAEKSEDWKQSHTILDINNRRVVGRSSNNSGAYGGLVYANAHHASSNSYTYYGSRLAFKSEALAQYAGKQFIEIYADFQLSNKI